MAHTKGPWELDTCGEPWIINGGGDLSSADVAICEIHRYRNGSPLNPSSDEERESNAKFIVRAVNSHAELLEALEKANKVLSSFPKQTRVGYEILLLEIDQALDKAKGE